MIAALCFALIMVVVPTRRWRRRHSAPEVSDLVLLATLVGLGLDAGMAPAGVLAWVRPYVHRDLSAAVATITRRAQLDGLVVGLRSASGHGAGLFRTMARAVETGAALGPVLAAFQERAEAEAAAAAEVRLRRLPVKLVVPLALLMLPGLVLMVAGPALIEVFGRFT